jgi:two-component system response regulator RegX3
VTAQEPGRGFSYHWPGTMAESVLVVEDEVAIADAVTYALESEGFEVDRAGDGEEALERARRKEYELIVLDLRLPKVNGIEVTRILRGESIVPILMLTAKDSEVDRVVGLEVGADDYVTKPFSMAELISRVRAILRRRQLDRLSGDPVRRVGGLRLDLVRHEVRVDDQNVRLTPSEFRLLTFLAEEPERVYSRREIMQHLWQSEYVGDERATDMHVSNLRRKIERDPDNPERVVTVRGIGYKLVPA